MKCTVDFRSQTGEWTIVSDVDLPIDDSGDPVGYINCNGFGSNVFFDDESRVIYAWETYLATDHNQQFHILIVSGQHDQAHVIAFETTAHYLMFSNTIGLHRMVDEVSLFKAKFPNE